MTSKKKVPETNSFRQLFHFSMLHFVMVLLSLIAVFVTIHSTNQFNAIVTADSASYISAARNIADGKGISIISGKPLVYHPPMYPAILSLIDVTLKVDPLYSARFLNALLFGLIVLFSGLLFENFLKESMGIIVFGSIMVLVQPVLVRSPIAVLSDLLFTFLSLLFLYFFEIYLKKRTTTSLIFIGILASLAALTRYIGISHILFGSIYLLLCNNKTFSVKRIQHFIIYFVISAFPILIYLMRNYFLSGSLIGQSLGSGEQITIRLVTENIVQVINSYSTSFISWFIDSSISNGVLLLTIGFLLGFILAIKQDERLKKKFQWIPFRIVIFIVIYAGSLFLTVIGRAHFEERYLIPIFIPTLLLLLLFIQIYISSFLENHLAKASRLVFLALFIVVFIYPVRISFQLLKKQRNSGSGYTGSYWRSSGMINYLAQNQNFDQSCTIYSNGSDVLYILLGYETDSVINKNFWGADGIEDITTMKGIWPPENIACIIWFDKITWRDYLYTPVEFSSIVKFTHQIDLDDGAIYFVSK